MAHTEFRRRCPGGAPDASFIDGVIAAIRSGGPDGRTTVELQQWISRRKHRELRATLQHLLDTGTRLRHATAISRPSPNNMAVDRIRTDAGPGEAVTRNPHPMKDDQMRMRHRLPNRRSSTTFDFEFSSMKFTATVSYFEDGTLGEIFLMNHRNGSHADAVAKDSAIVCSIAL